MDIDPTALISAEHAAEILHQRPQTLATWRASGRGPRFFKLGRAVFYHPDDLSAWVAAQRQEPAQAVA